MQGGGDEARKAEAKADLDLVQELHKQQALVTEGARLKLEAQQELDTQRQLADAQAAQEVERGRDKDEIRRELEKELEKQSQHEVEGLQKQLEGLQKQLEKSRNSNATLKGHLEVYQAQQAQLQDALDKAKTGKRGRDPDEDEDLPPPPPPVRL